MTPEQQEALAAVRTTLLLVPERISPQFAGMNPGLASSWISELRGVLQQVAAAFPEGEAS